MWINFLQFGVVGLLLVLGFSVGTIVERAHFKRLDRREAATRSMFVSDLSTAPGDDVAELRGAVFGEVVIASDYFKTFAARIRNMIGGEVRAFESLMERARREAILRMLEEAQRKGANAVINVRLSSSSIGSVRRRQGAAMVEMCAFGTAFFVPDLSRSPT